MRPGPRGRALALGLARSAMAGFREEIVSRGYRRTRFDAASGIVVHLRSPRPSVSYEIFFWPPVVHGGRRRR